jgi:hypothetical protein
VCKVRNSPTDINISFLSGYSYTDIPHSRVRQASNTAHWVGFGHSPIANSPFPRKFTPLSARSLV